MSKKPAKSESLTIRMDPKTRFMLEFVSRLRGQTITTVVERAISEAANEAKISQYNSDDETWRDYWRINDGERALLIAAESQLFPTYEEEKRLAFAKLHHPFFYVNVSKNLFITHYVDVLWPRIDDFMELYEQTKSTDYFAAGKAMQEALKQAKLRAPDWPTIAPTAASKFSSADMDDDIPF